MNFSEDYYKILGIDKNSDEKEIKKSYYKLSKKYHPDLNKDCDKSIFLKISESYSILTDKSKKEEYDIKSKWGKNYDERTEMLEYEFDNIANGWDEDKLTDFKKKEALNIVIHVGESFNGSVEYERWVVCKSCKGTGKDLKSKIEIKDAKGNIKFFEAEDGCDFCDGTGKDEWDNECVFCFGQGKAGSKECQTCKGEKRILGKQKLSGIDFDKDFKELKVEFMGNFSKDAPGKVGHLWLIRKI